MLLPLLPKQPNRATRPAAKQQQQQRRLAVGMVVLQQGEALQVPEVGAGHAGG
jgi:hypothetical protein